MLALQGSQKKQEKGSEKIFEDIEAENFTNPGKETVIHVQEAQKVPYRMIPKRNTPRHIAIKMTKIKDKERILSAAREKQQITHKETPIGDFSEKTTDQQGVAPYI